MSSGRGLASRLRGVWYSVVAAVIVTIGATVFTFPFAAHALTAHQQANVAEEYSQVGNSNAEGRYREAVAANRSGDYESALERLTLEGVDAIARVRIPSIRVDLPVYPTSSSSDLRRGAGHLEGTSLPVGGEGTHAGVTAHSGMPTARMFDKLPSLEVGDLVVIDVLGQSLPYKVTKTVVDTPEDGMRRLEVQPGKDLLTLVTCTPYGVNTHRLIVTAQSSVLSSEEPLSAGTNLEFPWWAIAYVVVLAGAWLMVIKQLRRQGTRVSEANAVKE